MNIDEMFSSMGVDPTEVVDDRQEQSVTDKRICICGHGASKHKDLDDNKYKNDFGSGVWMCKPNAMDCLCKVPYPVMEVSNTRYFLRRTTGAGKLHALLKGMSALAAKGGTAKWLIELTCAKCKVTGEDKGITPVPLNKLGRQTFDGLSEGNDTFLCIECRKDI